MDCHLIQTNWCLHLCHPTIFMQDVLPAQPSQFILAWDRHQICWLAYPVAWLHTRWLSLMKCRKPLQRRSNSLPNQCSKSLILSHKCFHPHSVQPVNCVIISKMKSLQITTISDTVWIIPHNWQKRTKMSNHHCSQFQLPRYNVSVLYKRPIFPSYFRSGLLSQRQIFEIYRPEVLPNNQQHESTDLIATALPNFFWHKSQRKIRS